MLHWFAHCVVTRPKGLERKLDMEKTLRVLWLAFVFTLSAQTALAQSTDLICDLVGHGSYYYDPEAMVDYYTLEGTLAACRTGTDPVSVDAGRFTLEGEVATVGQTGPGALRIWWDGGQPSVGWFTLAGIPEMLAASGYFTKGSYAGADFELTTLCTLQSTTSCFQTGSSSFAYTGTLTVRR